jgi:hypothetical protein
LIKRLRAIILYTEKQQVTFQFKVVMASTQLVFLIVILFVSQGCEAWFFRSSQENKAKAYRNYPDSPVQRFVATSFGDEIPNMRDDLIRRKKNGEGSIKRHWNAWRTLDNWKVDPDNDEKELNNPAAP